MQFTKTSTKIRLGALALIASLLLTLLSHSIIAGGRYVDSASSGDFYLRKFAPTGAIDASLKTSGIARANFNSQYDGAAAPELPQVLKAQPDDKIVFATFGGGALVYDAGSTNTHTVQPDRVK